MRSGPRSTAAKPTARLQAEAKPKGGTILSFFKPQEHPNKRAKLSPSAASPRPAPPQPPRVTIPARRAVQAATATLSTPTKPKPKLSAGAKLTQLFLDPFEDVGHSMLSCAECGMTYARTIEDMAVHGKHHKRVVGGCDWLAGDGVGKGCTLVEDGVEWGQKGKHGKVLMVEGGAEGLTGKKVSRLSSGSWCGLG